MRQNLSLSHLSFRRVVWFLLLFSVGLAGCGGEAKDFVPVEGKVVLDSKPLPGGKVVLIPDTAKGNQTPDRLFGTINSEGVYRIETERGKGAPPGAYKVLIFPPLPTDKMDPSSILIPAKYQDEKNSNLNIEVTKNPTPGAYDLQLKQ